MSNSSDTRVRVEIPSAFDLKELVAFLGERRGKFNIRAAQSWGSLYVLDLAETYKFLKNLSEYNDNSQSTFLEFIDHRVIDSKDKAKNWLSCVKDCDPMNNVYVSAVFHISLFALICQLISKCSNFFHNGTICPVAHHTVLCLLTAALKIS